MAAAAELRATVKTALTALLVFALLSLNTCANIRARETWDDLYAWLLLKRFSVSLPLTTDETVNERRLGRSEYCGDKNDPLYRTADPEGLLKYGWECPYLGELIRMKGTYTGWYQKELWLEPVYPEPIRLRVFLYINRHSSLFWGSERTDRFNTIYDGHKFELLDPRVTTYDEEELKVVGDYRGIPFGDYVLARYTKPVDRYFVLRRRSWDHYMHVEGEPFVRIDPADDEPWSWTKAQILLARQGIDPDPDKLSLANSEVLKALANAYDDPADVDIAGFGLPGGPFLTVFSLLFVMIALGSRAATRELARVPRGHPVDAGTWVFAAPRAPGATGRLVEWILVLTSLVIAAAPILCFLIQFSLGVWPGAFGGWLLGTLNLLAAVASALLLISMFIALTHVRQAAC